MVCRTGRSQRRIRSGFTLVELLLAVALILLLFGAVIFNFSTFERGASLDEGATQFEALLRFARAHASGSGRLVQIRGEETGRDAASAPSSGLHVVWEPDPLGAPGVFVDLPEAASYVHGIDELVSVLSVRSLDANAMEAIRAAESESETETNRSVGTGESSRATFSPITFFPDGSSDSAQITLASRNDDDPRRLGIRLTGLTGMLRREFLPPSGRTGEAESSPPASPQPPEHSP